MGASKRNRTTDVTKPRKQRDPLGKLQQTYEVTLAGVVVVAGGIAVLGCGALGWGLWQASLGWEIFGAAVIFIGFILAALSITNIGRKLEVRRHGVRFTERGTLVEMTWDDIAAVETDRRDDTYLGVANVSTRGNDYRKPTGPLTKTEFHVTIRAHDGREIHLKPLFLKMVPSPQNLITELRMRAGV